MLSDSGTLLIVGGTSTNDSVDLKLVVLSVPRPPFIENIFNEVRCCFHYLSSGAAVLESTGSGFYTDPYMASVTQVVIVVSEGVFDSFFY